MTFDLGLLFPGLFYDLVLPLSKAKTRAHTDSVWCLVSYRPNPLLTADLDGAV